ncbi:hypothetical protein B566_EDAN014938 [Ephemera danica]|nr:hypothetical protein B566_EDAN014938 [Ephemera danica]
MYISPVKIKDVQYVQAVQVLCNVTARDARGLPKLHHVRFSQGAIDFYKKFGFEIVETKEQYCQRIEPADAHVLRKTMRRPYSNGLPPESKS